MEVTVWMVKGLHTRMIELAAADDFWGQSKNTLNYLHLIFKKPHIDLQILWKRNLNIFKLVLEQKVFLNIRFFRLIIMYYM